MAYADEQSYEEMISALQTYLYENTRFYWNFQNGWYWPFIAVLKSDIKYSIGIGKYRYWIAFFAAEIGLLIELAFIRRFDWIFEHLDEWSENDINVDHVGISVYSDMLEKFIKRFGFEYKGLNPAKGKVYEATIKALKHNSLVKKRYPHFCQKDSLDPDE